MIIGPRIKSRSVPLGKAIGELRGEKFAPGEELDAGHESSRSDVESLQQC